MRHILDYFNVESPKVIRESIKAKIESDKPYLLTYCHLDDDLYLDESNISVEGDLVPLASVAAELENEIQNLRISNPLQMTTNLNFRCFVIHPDSSEIIQENT